MNSENQQLTRPTSSYTRPSTAKKSGKYNYHSFSNLQQHTPSSSSYFKKKNKPNTPSTRVSFHNPHYSSGNMNRIISQKSFSTAGSGDLSGNNYYGNIPFNLVKSSKGIRGIFSSIVSSDIGSPKEGTCVRRPST